MLIYFLQSGCRCNLGTFHPAHFMNTLIVDHFALAKLLIVSALLWHPKMWEGGFGFLWWDDCFSFSFSVLLTNMGCDVWSELPSFGIVNNVVSKNVII